MHNGVATVQESLNGALAQRGNRKLARYGKYGVYAVLLTILTRWQWRSRYGNGKKFFLVRVVNFTLFLYILFRFWLDSVKNMTRKLD